MANPTVMLYPGAGSSCDHSSLVAIEQRLGRSAAVERIDFPYRREGRRAPDRAPRLMASIRDDLAGFARRRGPIVMGGRSMGGRMTSMVAAGVDGGGAVARLAGLVLICYPLHPPAKPENLRVEHLADIAVPCLFISGTRDPFGSPEELMRWTSEIPAPVEHVWIEDGRHDLKGADATIAAAAARFIKRHTVPGQT
ncbi:MAG TPA: alpha/beta family hydrolase [Ilumatobacteraceae bacterium]|nr:alpha/beta family hydrolase [Ilumatobacteraceae bacterium]